MSSATVSMYSLYSLHLRTHLQTNPRQQDWRQKMIDGQVRPESHANQLLRHAVTVSNCTKETTYTGRELYFSLSVLLMYGTNCLSQLILDRYHCSCSVSTVWIYLANYIYNCTFFYLYNGFYVFDFTAHCWATFSALCALLSSHIMTNNDDDDDINR